MHASPCRTLLQEILLIIEQTRQTCPEHSFLSCAAYPDPKPVCVIAPGLKPVRTTAPDQKPVCATAPDLKPVCASAVHDAVSAVAVPHVQRAVLHGRLNFHTATGETPCLPQV